MSSYSVLINVTIGAESMDEALAITDDIIYDMDTIGAYKLTRIPSLHDISEFVLPTSVGE